jgi:hypothetical protein
MRQIIDPPIDVVLQFAAEVLLQVSEPKPVE